MKNLVFTAAAASGIFSLMGTSIAHACNGPGTALTFDNSPIFPGAKEVRVQRVSANVPSQDTANVFKGDNVKPLNALVVEFPNGEKEYYAFTTDTSGKKLLCNFDQTGANQCFDFEGRTSRDSSLLPERPSERVWIDSSKEYNGLTSYSYSFGTKSRTKDVSDLTEVPPNKVSLVIHPGITAKHPGALQNAKLTFDFSKNELQVTSIVNGKSQYTYSNRFNPKNLGGPIKLEKKTVDLNAVGNTYRIECKDYREGDASAGGNSVQGSKVEPAN